MSEHDHEHDHDHDHAETALEIHTNGETPTQLYVVDTEGNRVEYTIKGLEPSTDVDTTVSEVGHDHDHGGDFLGEYTELITDPAHIAFEITIAIIFDLLVLSLLIPMIRKFVKERLGREHYKIDTEHGIVHHGDHVHREDPPTPMDDCVETEDFKGKTV